MDFKEVKSIYLQIAERISNEIMANKYASNERIPSIREYAALLEVNANTVVKSYDYLQNKGLIYNQRGRGYFVSENAKELIYKEEKKKFIKEDLPTLFRKIDLLKIDIDEIIDLYQRHQEKEK